MRATVQTILLCVFLVNIVRCRGGSDKSRQCRRVRDAVRFDRNRFASVRLDRDLPCVLRSPGTQ